MLLIPEETAQQIVDYLVKRPYCEVFQLINHLTSLQTLQDTKVNSEHTSKQGETNGRG